MNYSWSGIEAYCNTLIPLGPGNFVGLFDDIAAFNKALSPEEISYLYQLKQGAAELHKQ
jgi:hypothetical protein